MRSTHATLGINSGFPGLTAYPLGRLTPLTKRLLLSKAASWRKYIIWVGGRQCRIAPQDSHHASIFLHKPLTQGVPKCKCIITLSPALSSLPSTAGFPALVPTWEV